MREDRQQRIPILLTKISAVRLSKVKEFGNNSGNSAEMDGALGLCDDEWVKAVTEQLTKVQHTSNLYYSSPCATLASLLSERTGCKKTFFSNSGAEANECAIKTARKWALDNKGEGYYNIITLKNSFHGRTITWLSFITTWQSYGNG